MEATYRIPFERFERTTLYGTIEDVADLLLPYVGEGADHLNLIMVQDSLLENVEMAAAVRFALHERLGASPR